MATLRLSRARSGGLDLALVAATLVLCAFFAARAATQLIARALPAASGLGAPRAEAPSDAPAGHHARDVRRILARDAFDAEAGDLTLPAALAPAVVRALGDAPGALPCPARGARVVGSVIADGAPAWSFALIARDATSAARPYRVGSVLDDATIESIGWNPSLGAFVVLAPAAASGPACYRAQRTPGGDVAPAAPALSARVRGVQVTGPHELTIDRGALARLGANPQELMRSMRLQPYARGGRALGVQVSELVPGALGQLGLADGDVLERLDGGALDTPDRWLEVYARITSGTLDRATLTVLRGGRERTLDVVVR